MEDDRYKKIFEEMDKIHVERKGCSLRTKDPTSIVKFIKDFRTELSDFITEVAGRTKAGDEWARKKVGHHETQLGETYRNTQPIDKPVIPS